MEKETKGVKGGIGKFVAMTFIGLGLIIVGIVFAAIGPVLIATQHQDGFIALTIIGFILIFGPGLALMSVGIPCWIAKGSIIKASRGK